MGGGVCVGCRQWRGFTIWLGGLTEMSRCPTQVSPSRDLKGLPLRTWGLLSRIGPWRLRSSGGHWGACSRAIMYPQTLSSRALASSSHIAHARL